MSAVEKPQLEPVDFAQELLRIENEFEALTAEFETATPERQAEIGPRISQLVTRFTQLSAQVAEGTAAAEIRLGDLDDAAEFDFQPLQDPEFLAVLAEHEQLEAEMLTATPERRVEIEQRIEELAVQLGEIAHRLNPQPLGAEIEAELDAGASFLQI